MSGLELLIVFCAMCVLGIFLFMFGYAVGREEEKKGSP